MIYFVYDVRIANTYSSVGLAIEVDLLAEPPVVYASIMVQILWYKPHMNDMVAMDKFLVISGTAENVNKYFLVRFLRVHALKLALYLGKYCNVTKLTLRYGIACRYNSS